jgi:hypothetical protein
LAHETKRSANKVGFIREKRKAAPRDGQGAWKTGSSLLFTLKGFLFGPFCWGGSQESGVEWSFNISLQEHTQSCESLLFIAIFEAFPGGHDL